jgi:hypothetical protein
VHLSAKGRRFRPVAETALAELDDAAVAELGQRAAGSTASALSKLSELSRGSPD